MEIVPHGVPGIGLVEGTVVGASTSVVGVTEEVSIVGKAEVVTLAVGISNGDGSDVSALEEEIGPDGCLAVTKVKGIETNIGLQMNVDISIARAGARVMMVTVTMALTLIFGRGDGGEAKEGGNKRCPDLHTALAVVFTTGHGLVTQASYSLVWFVWLRVRRFHLSRFGKQS